jgi:hypothetical protein
MLREKERAPDLKEAALVVGQPARPVGLDVGS